MDLPDVHYARAGGVAVAYQVVGEGPQTLVFSPQISDLFTIWLSNYTRSFLDRLASRVQSAAAVGLSARPRKRFWSSSGVKFPSRYPTPCSRRCSSPTSSARRNVRPRSVTGLGGIVLTRHHADVRRELARFRGEEVDSAGDGFFCRFDGPARAMACARAIVDGARELDLDVRSGIHTGECELVGEKIAGIAVVTGSRISSLAAPGEVLVSSTVKDLVAGSGFSFDDRGEHELKGVPGTWRLYAVAAGQGLPADGASSVQGTFPNTGATHASVA